MREAQQGQRHRLLRVLAAGSAAVMLAGCSGIPTSGPVHQGAAIVVAQEGPVTQSIAQPPKPGDSPLAIVVGFLFASASFANDHAVARKFLTPDVSKTWNPLAAKTTVYAIDPTADLYKQNGPAEVDLTATQLGVISPTGEYTDAATDTSLTFPFALKKVAGQWRIANPPPGLFLTAQDRDRNYRAFDVYFLDPTSQILVPNQILVPVGLGTSTALVKAVIAGPTAWLAPAVHTAVPTGTKLLVDSAPIDPTNGIVEIQLSLAAASATPPDPVGMSAQFVWTLKQLHSLGVNGVAITVGGIPLRVPGGAPSQRWDAWQQYDPDGQTLPNPAAVFSTEKGPLGILASDKPRQLPGPLGDGTFRLYRPGLSFDQRQVAGLDKDGHKLFVSTVAAAVKPAAAAVTGVALTAPSWDRFGVVWTVDQRPTGPVAWMDLPVSAAKQVALPKLPAGQVLALRIARDGVRAVMVLKPDGATTAGVYIGTVEQRGEPDVSLSDFRPISTPFADVTDVAWLSADQLVVLGRQAPGGAEEPVTIDLAGSSVSSLGPIASSSDASTGIISVTAAPGQEILVSTSDGKVYGYLPGGWSFITEGLSPSYPG